MVLNDKNNIFRNLDSFQPLMLELGCGNGKKQDNWIGIDSLDYPCVDIVGDVFDVLDQFPNNSVDGVFASHFFEHIADLPKLLESLARVLKASAEVEVVVPHFSNAYFYSDYTHKQAFGLYSFSYLAEDQIFRRQVPKYIDTVLFQLVKVDLVFKSSHPFYGRAMVKKIVGSIFNINRYMQEFYEENLCYLFTCYEIKFILRKIAPPDA